MKSEPMSISFGPPPPPEPVDPVELLKRAARAKKCGPCGCAHDAAEVLSELPDGAPEGLVEAARELGDKRVAKQYECLGCAVCWPAQALDAAAEAGLVSEEAVICPVEPATPREGWPPLPGDYTLLRYTAPVAVCTLGDKDLAAAVTAASGPGLGVVGTLTTENLGIERLVQNTISNPNLRFVIVAGEEVEQKIGHHPGGTLLALAANGTDARGRIIDAPGRRPRLQNLTAEEIGHFRDHVEVVDLIGTTDPAAITAAARELADRDPGPAPAPPSALAVPVTQAVSPQRLIADPAGYLVVHIDRPRRLLIIEHYRNNGTVTSMVEARGATDGYTTVLEAGLVSRLDHAAYLGRELARAELALLTGGPYRQDAAPGGEIVNTEEFADAEPATAAGGAR
ncbi:DUF4346 domain-containing protein [Streptomyces sp. NPDC006349]|uniref:DUF4346 domain-containing protein n=1 Tax=Streptomyces sp. NPDC006349 TaxID=3156757 RepID=UPI0007C7531B